MSTPLTVISGFLGAGKTTLLQHLLRADHGLRIGVLVNDFGAVNIDAMQISSLQDGDVVSLENGCVCCSIRDDLLEAVWQLLDHPEPPDYLVVEASGVADPSGIAFTFSVAGVRERVCLDAVITVLDATQPPSVLPESVHPLLVDQAAPAHLILLNKHTDATAAQHAEWKAWLHAHAPRAQVIETEYARVPAAAALNLRQADAEQLAVRQQSHEAQFSTWTGHSDAAIVSLPVLQTALQQLPSSVLRVKGWVRLEGWEQGPLMVHRVGQRTNLEPGADWPSGRPETCLVLIATAGGLEPALLEEWFASLLAAGK